MLALKEKKIDMSNFKNFNLFEL